MENKKNTTFDKRDVFEEKIRPLLDELILQCGLHKIPCFFTACVGNSPEGSEYVHVEDEEHSRYVNDAVGTGSRMIYLTDDQIKKHLCIVCGFDVVPSRKAVEINMDEFFGDDDDIVKSFPGLTD